MMRAIYIIKKDLSLIITRSAGLAQAILLGLLLIFLFSLAKEPAQQLSPQAAATMFWLSSLFCQVLVFQMLYSLEEQSKSALILASPAIQTICLAKAISGLIIILIAQLIFFPACIIFLGQSVGANIFYGLAGFILVDFALIICGSLLGALAAGEGARESLLSVIIFPLLIPPILAGISLLAAFFSPEEISGLESWLGIALAFDCFFLAAAILLFPFIYSTKT